MSIVRNEADIGEALINMEDTDTILMGLVGSCMMVQEYQGTSMKIRPDKDVLAQQIIVMQEALMNARAKLDEAMTGLVLWRDGQKELAAMEV